MSDIVLTKTNFDKEVLKSETPVLVYFWADWCSDCQRFSPLFDQLSHEYKKILKVAKVNIEQSMEIADKFGVMSIPTLILFKNGTPVTRTIEVFDKNLIKQTIDKELCKNEIEGYYEC